MTKCLPTTEIATLGRSFMEANVLLAAVKTVPMHLTVCRFFRENGGPSGRTT